MSLEKNDQRCGFTHHLFDFHPDFSSKHGMIFDQNRELTRKHGDFIKQNG